MAKKQAYTGAKRGRKPKISNPEAAGMKAAAQPIQAEPADDVTMQAAARLDQARQDVELKRKVVDIVEAMLPALVAKHVMDARLQNLVADEIDRRMVVLTFRKPGDVSLPVVAPEAEDQDIHIPGGAALG